MGHTPVSVRTIARAYFVPRPNHGSRKLGIPRSRMLSPAPLPSSPKRKMNTTLLNA
ncbi:hypothetical protein CPB85DRAFT_1329823 [Mucidula mucida]|nr:hypothetical protein CPB85DRAFT_1329823 [Mucidula mucida]